MLQANEWALHRELRVAALTDSPASFGQQLHEIASEPVDAWRPGAEHLAEGQMRTMFVARVGEHPIGMVYGLTDPVMPRRSRVGGMWVHPEQRGSGAGSMLLQAVIEWGRTRGSERIALWVPLHGSAARALYRRAGFVETGAERPFPNRPGDTILEMELWLV